MPPTNPPRRTNKNANIKIQSGEVMRMKNK
jgi:hypothetical protein